MWTVFVQPLGTFLDEVASLANKKNSSWPRVLDRPKTLQSANKVQPVVEFQFLYKAQETDWKKEEEFTWRIEKPMMTNRKDNSGGISSSKSSFKYSFGSMSRYKENPVHKANEAVNP